MNRRRAASNYHILSRACLLREVRLREEGVVVAEVWAGAPARADEFKDRPMEVSYREIILKVKEIKIPFKGSDIAGLAAQYLHEKGFKIWR